ncbi:MAG: hypothetical protein K0S32_2485 [Bacteroidetes bacterium]|jgi:hypothetical protein|nr:hypothetical protein [Bacteroidota bacterium]
MKTNKIYNERLLRFADHIKKIKNHPEHGILRTVYVHAIEGKFRIHVEVKTQYWFFDELVACFPKLWSFSEITGDPIFYRLGKETNTSDGVCSFFGLKGYEAFLHLWDIEGYQKTEKWGGQILTEDSEGEQLANQIEEFVKNNH